MKYKDYIDLGFKRHDMDDEVEFRQTGYGGFSLEKQVTGRIAICASSGEIDKPLLYIKKGDSDTNHIIEINSEIVRDLTCS